MKISGLLGLVTVLGMTVGCAMQPSQQSQQLQSSISPIEEDSRDIVVYFLPLDDFDVDVSASLAQYFSEEFGVRMKSALPMGSRELQPFEGTQQYAGEGILIDRKSVV